MYTYKHRLGKWYIRSGEMCDINICLYADTHVYTCKYVTSDPTEQKNTYVHTYCMYIQL